MDSISRALIDNIIRPYKDFDFGQIKSININNELWFEVEDSILGKLRYQHDGGSVIFKDSDIENIATVLVQNADSEYDEDSKWSLINRYKTFTTYPLYLSYYKKSVDSYHEVYNWNFENNSYMYFIKNINDVPQKINKYMGYIYAMEIGDKVKIGYTQDPKKRFYTLERGALYYGLDVGRIAISIQHDNFTDNERLVHKMFEKHRFKNTEMFNLSIDNVVKDINAQVFDTIEFNIRDGITQKFYNDVYDFDNFGLI